MTSKARRLHGHEVQDNFYDLHHFGRGSPARGVNMQAPQYGRHITPKIERIDVEVKITLAPGKPCTGAQSGFFLISPTAGNRAYSW
jgi:hypothetical protein